MPRMQYEAWMERKYLTGSTGKLREICEDCNSYMMF
jgi:hypothetical protein